MFLLPHPPKKLKTMDLVASKPKVCCVSCCKSCFAGQNFQNCFFPIVLKVQTKSYSTLSKNGLINTGFLVFPPAHPKNTLAIIKHCHIVNSRLFRYQQ